MAQLAPVGTATPPKKPRRGHGRCELCGVTHRLEQLARHITRDYQGAPIVVLICRDPEQCITAADAGHVTRLARRGSQSKITT